MLRISELATTTMQPHQLVWLLLTTLLPAQGVLPLNGTWRFAGTGIDAQDSCAAVPVPTASVIHGTATLTLAGTITSAVTQVAICGDGTPIPPSLFPSTSGYQVGADGIMLVASSQVPESHNLMGVTADGSAFLFGRGVEGASNASLNMGVRLSSGRSNASLAGPYQFVRLVHNNVGGAYVVRVESGTIVFNGIGGMSETLTLRHSVPYNGIGITATTPSTTNGTYAVATDGSITTLPNTSGALTADGELFILERHAVPNLEFTIGIRQAATSVAALEGDWLIATTTSNVGSGAIQSGGPFGTTLLGTLHMNSTGPGNGTIVGPLSEVATWRFGSSNNFLPMAGTFALSPSTGAVSLQPGSSPIFSGAVSANGKYQIGFSTGSSGAGVLLGLSRIAWPTSYGAATPGSAGLSPQLQTFGGFPSLGNVGFGVLLASGLGGSPAVMAFCGGPASVPILGGTVLIDPGQQLLTPSLLLSGPLGATGAGAAGLLLPLPPSLLLAGLHVFAQGFVLDPSAPQGLAMTAGLELHLCR